MSGDVRCWFGPTIHDSNGLKEGESLKSKSKSKQFPCRSMVIAKQCGKQCVSPRCCFFCVLFLLLLLYVIPWTGLSNIEQYIFIQTNDVWQDVPPSVNVADNGRLGEEEAPTAETLPETTQDPFQASKLFFLLWTLDFELGDETDFILGIAQEIAGFGHKVLLESPVEGALLKDLNPQYDGGARENPLLRKILSRQSSVWDAVGDAELPHFIMFFSSVWGRSLVDLPRHPNVRFVWFFYHPRKCEDIGCGIRSKKLGSKISLVLASFAFDNR